MACHTINLRIYGMPFVLAAVVTFLGSFRLNMDIAGCAENIWQSMQKLDVISKSGHISISHEKTPTHSSIAILRCKSWTYKRRIRIYRNSIYLATRSYSADS